MNTGGIKSQGTVLKVDDTIYPLDILANLLAKNGLKVLFAEDGETGIQIAEQSQPDVVRFSDAGSERVSSALGWLGRG